MPPRWYDRLTAGLVAALLGFGFVGLVAAEFGVFVVAIVLFVGGATAYTIYLVGHPARPEPATSGGRVAALVVVVAIGTVGAGGLFHSEQLLSTSEAGGINNAAVELARDGDLEAERTGPFDAVAERLGPAGMFTSLAGAAAWFGTDAMLWTGPLVAGVAVLALYALGARLVRPWVAATVTIAVAVNPVFVYAARDTTPEPLVMVFVLSGIALLIEARQHSDPRGAAAGAVLLGATALARPEWILLAPAVAVYLGLELRRAGLLEGWLNRRRHARYVTSLVVGFSIPAALAMWLTREAGRVFTANGPGPGWAVLATAGIGAGFWLARRRPGLIARPVVRVGQIAVAVIAFGLLLGVSRPLLLEDNGAPSTAVAMAQAEEGVRIEADRSYAENSAVWLLWYLGPVTAAAGLLGAGLVTDSGVRSRSPRWTALLVLGGTTTVVWLLHPGLLPLHPATMARFLPLAIPGLVLLAGWVIDRLWGSERLRAVAQAGAIAVAVGVVAFPAWYLAQAPDAAQQVGLQRSLGVLCDEIGDDSAVVIVDTGSVVAQGLVQPLRGFCEVPAAPAIAPTIAEARQLAEAWAREGRELVVLSDSATPFPDEGAPRAGAVPPLAWESLQPTLTRRPTETVDVSVELFVTPLDR